MAGYRKSEISFDTAKKRAVGYPCALVYQMSEVYFGKTEDIVINWDELLEARFFSESGELHLFRCEKEWRAVVAEDAEPSNVTGEVGGGDAKIPEDRGEATAVLLKNYQLAAKYRSCGGELVVKEYLSEDEDGQVFVGLTRLCGIA